MFRHGFDLLFGKLKAVFAFFRNVSPGSGDLVHRPFDGGKLPVECRERIVRSNNCLFCNLFQCSMLLRELQCSLAHRILCSLSSQFSSLFSFNI